MTKKQEKKHLKFFQKIPSLIVGLYNKGKFLLRLEKKLFPIWYPETERKGSAVV